MWCWRSTLLSSSPLLSLHSIALCSLWVPAVFIKKLHTMLTLNQVYIWAVVSLRRGLLLLRNHFSYYSIVAFAALSRQRFNMVGYSKQLLWIIAPNSSSFSGPATFFYILQTLLKKRKRKATTATETLRLLGSWRNSWPRAPSRGRLSVRLSTLQRFTQCPHLLGQMWLPRLPKAVATLSWKWFQPFWLQDKNTLTKTQAKLTEVVHSQPLPGWCPSACADSLCARHRGSAQTSKLHSVCSSPRPQSTAAAPAASGQPHRHRGPGAQHPPAQGKTCEDNVTIRNGTSISWVSNSGFSSESKRLQQSSCANIPRALQQLITIWSYYCPTSQLIEI